MQLSVVVASRDRRELLERMLGTLWPQLVTGGVSSEVVVVDDGSVTPYVASRDHPVRVLRTRGVGPARARNRGVAATSGAVVAFLDDDVLVGDGWVRALTAYLAAHPEAAGVTGRTTAPAHDPLYEHAVADLVGGSYLTCNVAYRREALAAVGGFDEQFAHAHEDRDLAWRVIDAVGPVGVCSAMAVTHPGRPFTVRDAVRRARFVTDDWLLFARYPERRAGRRSVRWTPLFNTARTWRDVFARRRPWRRPAALARFAGVAGGQLGLCALLTVLWWRRLADRPVGARPGLPAPGWRLAYVGPSPDPRADGAPGVAGLLLGELLDRGHQVDCFVAASREDDDPRALGERRGLSYVTVRSRFAFGRWYSRRPLTKMVSSQLFAAGSRHRLAGRLAARHAAAPYDFVYQFGTFESFGVPRRSGLPVLIHPSTHAAGERRWLLRDARAPLSDDSPLKRGAVAVWLAVRAWRQGRDARAADGVLALSAPFGEQIAADYRVDRARIRVVANAVVVKDRPAEPVTPDVVVAGRLVARKGLEDVRALADALARAGSRRRVRVIGGPSLWSDQRRALAGAAANLVLVGQLPRAGALSEMARATAVLQLSRYEPFGLTVAEALALGVPVIVTPAVGAAQFCAADVKVVVAPGDVAGLVSAVESLGALREDERALLAARCRAEAAAHFSPTVVVDTLLRAVSDLLG